MANLTDICVKRKVFILGISTLCLGKDFYRLDIEKICLFLGTRGVMNSQNRGICEHFAFVTEEVLNVCPVPWNSRSMTIPWG